MLLARSQAPARSDAWNLHAAYLGRGAPACEVGLTLETAGGHRKVILQSTGVQAADSGRTLALEWRRGELTYRLPQPAGSDGQIDLPPWFLPGVLGELSAADAGRSMAQTDPLLLTAVAASAAQSQQLANQLLGLRAQCDAVTYRAGQADRLTVDLQNARGELDALSAT